MEGIKLTPEQTTALQRRAREEGVTIHAAISAALTIAGRAIDENWRNNPLRIMSPAEIRDILGLKDQCMVSFGGGEISIARGDSMTFWDLARFAKDGLSAVKSRENISRMIDLQSAAVSSNLTVEQAFQLKRNAFNAQVMFTNLGRLPFDSAFRTAKTRGPLGTMCTPWHRRRADPWSSQRQRLAAPHAHQPHANPRPVEQLQPLVETTAHRLIIGEQVALAKWDSGKAVEDAPREAQVIISAMKDGAAKGLDEASVSNFFEAQIEADKLCSALLADWYRAGKAPEHAPSIC